MHPEMTRGGPHLSSPHFRGAACGLAAAILFGISPPLAKLLLVESSPLLIAGLLYLGAGLGLRVFELLSPRQSGNHPREAQIRPSDLWLLAGIVLTGGVLGPVFMLIGLRHLSGVLGSLLLNLEAPFTILLAVVLFGEHLGRRETTGALLIFSAAVVLSYHPEEMRADIPGLLAMVAACFSWAIDNNLTQRLSIRDPIVVTRIKTLTAGTCTLSLALIAGQSLPRTSILLSIPALGAMSYGVSLVLDIYALRLLGAAREAGYFATAPFMGAVAAVPILGERWGPHEFLATALMASGVFLLLREHHSHAHAHRELVHDHTHMHGDHHQHVHDEGMLPVEPHAHIHRHLPLIHDHPHVPEVHHRHEHE